MLPTMFRHLAIRLQRRFLEIDQSEKELPVVAMLVNETGRYVHSSQRTFHRCFLPSLSSFGQAVSEEKIFFKSTNQKQELPVVAMLVNESGRYEQFSQRTFHRWFLPSFDSFGQAVSEKKNLYKLTNQKQELSVVAMFVNGQGQNVQFLQRTFHKCFLPSFCSFGQVVSEEKIFQKSTNQKQELPVVAMFINGSGQNVQSLQRTFCRCFLLSFSSFG